MNDDGNKRKLYNALSKDYDMGSYEQFSQDVEDEGKRRKLYDAIKGDYDLPDFNGFSRQLAGGRRQAPAPAQSPVPTTQRQQQPQRRQQRSKAGRQQRSKARKMSPAQIAYFNASVARMRNSVAQTMERSKNISAYVKQRMFGGGVPAFGLGVGKKDRPTVFSSNNVVAGDIEYNPKTGKIEQTYLTQAGNKHTSRFSADMEQRRIDEEKERRLHPVESQLKAAEAEKERLAGLMRKRMEEIDARKTGHPVAGLIRDLADESHGMPGGLVSDNGMRDYRLDPRYRQLEAAARKNHQTIKTLRDKRDGLMNDFWHTLGDTLTNGYTFSDGQSDANDALSVMEAQRHVDAINRKRQTGEQLTKDEESAEAVLSNFATDEMVQGMYGNDYGAWARAATTTGTSLDFMKDILLTGGGAGALTKGIYKGVVKGGMKLLARKGVETGLKAAIGKGLLKATGVALGTTAAGAMITNTTGINRTAGEAGRLMAGHVGVNENGGYNIEGQKGMLEAIAEAERDMIGENQSEMFGEFIPGVGKYVRKGLEKIGLSRVSNALTSIGNKEWYRRYSKLLKAGGWNGLPGEGIEEYEGLLFDALTGHGSEALEQVQDPRTHIDIWLGCATMGALLGSAPAVAQAGSTAQYYRYKHQANKSGASAASFIGDRWNEMQEQIDGTPNGGMADVLTQMVLDPNLNHEQKNAVLDYARNLTKMRGCNLAAANNAGEEKDPDAEAANNAYGEGYNATEDTDMQDVKNRMEVLSESVGEFLGEDVMRDLEASPVDTLRTIRGFASLSDGQKQMAVDYVNAKSAYDGLIQRVRDDIDSEIAQSDAMVDSRVAREEQGGDGMIHPATLKEQDADGHDKQVFVVSGNVRMMDDGSMIDTGNSDETIIVRDAETGKLQFMSPGGLLSLGDVIDAEQLKEETRQQIRERKAREAADKTDGTLAFAIGDTYQFPDEAGGQHTYAIMQDLGDGMVAVALDGNQQMPVSMSKQELQAMADARNRSRVTNLISRQGQQTQAEVHNSRQPQYNLNEEITLQAGSEDVRAIVTSEENEDGLIEVESDQPINGRKVNMFSREQLDGMLSVPQIDEERAVLDGVSNVGDGLRDAMSGQSAAADEQAGAEPMPMIDVKGRMKPDWSKTTPQRAHAYLYNERGLSRENADAFVENNRKSAESELAKLRKKRPKMGTDLDEFEEKTADWQGKMDDLQRQHDYWKAVRHEQFKTDSAEQARISEKHARRMEEAKRRRAEEERLREEAERKEREAINGVPDMVDDTPQDARARGYRRVNGYKVDRQEPLQALQGKAVSVKFSNDVIPQGNVAVIDARQLQPSHAGGQRNPLHFIDEAQPKERIDDASRYASSKIAGNIRPEEITSSVTAYTGAPTINARGEVIQGNNRSDALRQMWQSYPEEAARYKQYLIGHAADFGLRAEDIEAMQSPVLVNMLDVEDAEAITLGQFVAQDTESGGTERIKAKNAVQKMGNDMRTFANLLLKSADEEATFAQLLDDNGTDVLKWMSQKGYITPTQYKSAFDGRGNVSGEAKNDLRSIMYQSVFRDGGTRLEEMFNAMPVKAQKAILATAYRDYDSPIAERMVVEIQNSIRAFNAMSQDEAFKKATNFKDAREAAEMWKRSYQFDDATGESYLPSENFSNFALLLATLYKGANQTTIQGTFNKLYDLIQGTQETSLFEQPDNTPRTLAQAIRETLNIEYNGQRRSNVLAGDSPAIQGGQQGSNGNAETGERAAPGEEPADGGGGTGSNSEEVNTPQIAPSGQLKTAGLRDVTNPDNAGIGTNAAKTKAQDKGGGVDRQGNPLNSDGTLYIEEVASIDDITDADFEEPTRTIALPDIPNNVRDAIGAGEKPVIIKKNIFERNGISHSDLTPEQSRDILRSALYNADLYGQNQKNTKPYNWVVINITDEAGKNKLVLLEVNQNNNNVEIVHWHYLDARGLEKLRRQADREDGQLLILPSIKEEVGALSDPTDELSSADKGSEISATEQEKTEEVAENEPTDARKAAVGGEGEAEQRLADSGRDADQDKGLSEDEADDLILLSADRAIPIPEMELTHENWVNEFGNGVLITPLGEIKLGENQFSKMIDKGREKEAGMIKPTLTDPDFVIEEASMATEGETERPASHLYVKSFIGIDGRKRYFFKSVTVKKDGMEVNVSNHFDRVKRLREALKDGKLLYRFDGGAQTEQSPATASVTTSRVEPGTSEGKVSENSATGQGKAGKSVENNGVEPFSSKMESASADVNTSPTDAQKEAGNYRKGHLKFDGYDISIENPKGSVRRGTDADGNEWEQEMQNTYGYIRGTEGVDGDHIDVFLSDDPTSGDVFVVDQVNKDGSFDEHKVMYGFPDIESARKAYLSNYEEGWQGLGAITPVSKEEFKKWIESSHRKTKPFAEYSGVKPLGDTLLGEKVVAEPQESAQAYTIEPAEYTNKKGKTTPMHLVRFSGELTKEQVRAGKELVREPLPGSRSSRGWWDAKRGGFMVRSEEAARELSEALTNDEAVQDAQPMSVEDLSAVNDHAAVQDAGEARLSGHAGKVKDEPQTEANETANEEPKHEEKKSGSKWVDDADAERFEELRKRLHKKLNGQLNMGIDPEAFAIGVEMSYLMLKHGARKFGEFARQMIDALGEDVRPYLKSFYNGARDLPEMADYEKDLTPYGEVRAFDVMNFDKEGAKDIIATAEHITREQEAGKQAEQAREQLKSQRNEQRKEAEQEVAANTATIRDEAEAVASETESKLASARSEREVNDLAKDIDDATDKVNDQLAVLGHHEAENEAKTKESQPKEKKSRKKAVTSQGQTMADLFSGLLSEDTTRPTSDEQEVHLQPRPGTSEREGGHQRGQNEPLGASQQHEDERADASRVAGRSGGNTMSDTAGSPRVSEPSDGKQPLRPAKKEFAPIKESERRNTHNNHSERGTDYAPKSTSARIEANIKAIETMQRLTESGQPATPGDMAVLRKFSGWGGLGEAFREKAGRGDRDYNPRLRDDYQPANPINARLRGLLSPEAYEAANMSRNSAYYTPAPVIDAMWDVARAMGFRGGSVLEGSAGIGNIIGLMPADMSERSNIHAVEIDETTGNILSLLYPDANVEVKGFEKTHVPNGSVDLAITNVPFVTGLRVLDETGDKDLSRKFHDIHDFCIAKNVRKLKEGGVGIFITSSGTLDSPNSAKLRTWLVNEGGADVVGAFRMHNQTFGGTGATSDIIVIRKRVNGQKSANAIDIGGTLPIRTVRYNTGETKRGSSEVIIKDLALDVNKHFVEHPEDMAGEMAFAFEKGDTYRATSKALYPSPGINQEQRLSEWARQFKDMDWDKAGERETQQVVYEDLGEDVKEGSMLLDGDGNLCLAQRGKAVPINVNANKVKGHTKAECFNAYKAIKDALADVLEYQTTHSDDNGLQQRLAKLNKAYDAFVKTYGHLNKNTSISFLRSDMDYPSIAALESVSETGDKSGKRIVTYGKTDIFSRRVVETESEPKPATIKDGIIASIYLNGRVDVPYIAGQLGKNESEVREQIIKSGIGFENPTTTEMEVSYEYLSGNVREKLRQAHGNNTDGRYDGNIKALERVIPMNIPAHLIEFTLGSSWVEPKLYEDFVKERTGIEVKLTNAGGTWIMSEPYWTDNEQNRAMGVYSEKCEKRILGHELIKAAITCKSISVTKTQTVGYGSSKTTETIVDKEATVACANKIDEIRQDFKDWARGKMQGDPEMSERMERVYNDLFNNSVPKEIPDEFVPEHFGGAATVVDGNPFQLRPHQAKAVVRATTQPLMLAHEVGTGKTYTLISTAMEMRRLGTARKPMIVVQNATVGQFVASAKALYPNAKILTLEDADRNAEGRRNFYAKIRYNDWDMIVVPQSVFERIPDSEERQIRFVEDKVEEKMTVLEKMREAASDDRDPVLRQAQRELDKLNDELNDLKLALQERKSGGKAEKDEKREAKTRQNAMVKAQEMLDRETDDVANFDDMGIDALLIDEAHEYKHLGFATAMQRGVKGVDPKPSKKSQGVYLKTQAVLESKNGKNVVFATGTPISNTAAEIWTFMRYLMPADTMREYGIYYFDDFVRNFGNIQQMLEFSTNGKYKENNRFAGYVNLPELVRIWAGVADTVLTREAGGVSDKIPEMEGGKARDIYLPQTKALRGVMKFVKDQLDDYERMSGKEKKENSHIPLVMYGIAKAAAVDARLVLEDAADEPNSKTNEAVRQTLRSLEDSKDYNGTVAIFADNYQNKSTGFNLYEDIRKKLIDAGVPEAQVVVMKSGMSIKKKVEIFDKVNRGEVRVIMGSTFTLGTGVNIQERLHTLIHVDAPNRPMDYTQRNGRILRQGNLHNEWGIPVRVLRFGVEDSLDVTAYQRLKTKGAIADSIMEGKKMMSNSMENRVLEEEQDLFGDITAQLSGSQYALLKNQVEKEVRKLEARRKQWEADQTYVHNQKPRLKALIKGSEERAARNKEALEKVEAAKMDGITVGKVKYPSLDAMVDYIKEYNSKQREQQEQVRTASGYKAEAKSDLTVNVGGFDFHVHRVIAKEQKQEKGQLSLSFFSKTQMTYSCPELGMEDIPVDGQRLKNALEDIVSNVMTGKDFREKAEYAERAAERYKGELQQVEARDGKPFEYADELKQAKDKLAEDEELMKAEMAEKEAKYAEMDASVDAAKGVQLSDEDSEEADTSLYRDDEDDLEDGEREETYRVMQVIDGQPYPPMAAVREGSESTSSRQAGNPADVRSRAAFARRQWRRAHDLANDWIEKLGIGEITSVYERIGDVPGNERFSKRRLRSKGWYDPETGRIAIVMNNHHSPQDVLQTILHEAVAHYGLRKLFGKNFDNFLDNVYDGADILIKERIAAKQAVLVSKGKNAKRTAAEWRRVATEEYLAELAESTDFENAGRQPWAMHWFNRIKSWFLDMLHSIGLKNFGGQSLSDTISDNELRYILWRSYKNLTAPGAYRNYFNVAEDIAMQDNLGVGNYSNSEVQGDMAAEKELFRDDDFSVRDKAIVRDAYERMVTTGGYQFQEAVQDSMLGLKRLYQAVLGKSTRIEDVSGNENAYLAENRMSSVNAAEQHEYYVRYMRPLLDVIGDMVGSNKYARNVLTDYMMAKHGLERNEVMAQRDFDTYHQQHPSGAKTLADFRERDYAGLTALTGEGDVAMAEQMAQQMVDDYEQDNDTDALWDAVRNATGATLEKIYSSGLLSKERYEQIQQMFENYIPLQGWDETTSDEVYGYLTSKNGPLTGSPIKHAAGRSSKADDPIATIALMADTAIRQGNRNKMKQTFLNFALNHPSDLVSVNDLWVHYNAVMDEWEPVFADIEPADTAEDVERKVAAFEERMKQLAESDPGNYKRGRDTQDVPYKVVRGNMREHQILVRRNGRTYVLTINGNPRAAQALNGLTNPDVELNGIAGNILRGAEWLNRNLSAFYTTRNPDFVARNFFRDMLYSNCMTWVKESPRYALRFHWNFGRVNPARLRMLLSKWERGTLDDGDYIERLFKQFMLNGGETGYTNVKDIEGKKRDIAAELKRQASKGRLAWHAVNMQLDLLNRSAENCARFAAFITSREMGRSMERSIHDAKEVSVNFNKKGSGGKMVNATGQTALGKMGAYIGGGGRLLYVFWNAGVQGTTNFARAAKRHPVKFTAGAASMFLLGAIVPMLAQAMGGGDDDDKDAYYNLPEYVRRSNILLNAGDQWISIPLPIEFRALYGLGELATGVITGNERYSDGELAFHLVSQVSQMLPLDVLEGGGGVNPFIPSAVKPLVEAYFINKSWSGMPIYKDTPWNKDAPEWQKAYKNANTYLVSGAKWLNEISGGDDYKKGFLDINPAKLEYLLGGMFGGAFTTADKLVKMGETVIGSREFDWRNMLIANGLIKTGDERTANRKLINEYFKYKDGYDETKRLLKNYSDAASAGDERYQRRLERLQASEDYLLYDVFDNYQPILKALHEAKDGASETMLSDIDGEENALRREMVDLMHAVEDDKHPDIDRNIDAMLEREFNAGGRTQKSAGSRIARRLGGTDGYGSPGDAYGEVYLQMRSYVDLAEDVLLQVELKKSKEAGDIERSKSIDRARREITEVKKDLTEADTDEDRNSIMEELRALRREKMEELGISMRPNR